MLKHVNAQLANDAIESLKSAVARHEMTPISPRADLQACKCLLAEHHLSIAKLHYAIGDSLDLVRSSLANALATYCLALESPVSKEAARRNDFSIVNSYYTYRYILIASILGQSQIIPKLLPMIVDPPNCSYLGSDVLTRLEHKIAYRFRQWQSNEDVSAQNTSGPERAERARLRNNVTEYQLLKTLIGNDRQLVLDKLTQRLDSFESNAMLRKHAQKTDCFLDISSLGLVTLALHNGLISKEVLPESKFAPWEILNL